MSTYHFDIKALIDAVISKTLHQKNVTLCTFHDKCPLGFKHWKTDDG